MPHQERGGRNAIADLQECCLQPRVAPLTLWNWLWKWRSLSNSQCKREQLKQVFERIQSTIAGVALH